MPTPDAAGVIEHRFDNGFRALLIPDSSAPIVSAWTWYRVGSRNERPGLTGISHWVEHMQFKGTPSLGKGQIFRDVSRHGGVLNAMTSTDWTAYYETLPAAQLSLALTIEADRMRNSRFDPAETDSERTVILSERLGAENRPTYTLYEELIGAAFRVHPYGHAVIGHEHDLKQITRDDLFAHYQQFYHPGNAYIVIAGDFDPDRVADQVVASFGAIPAGASPPPVRSVEPAQPGERRVTVRRPAPAAHLQIGYHAPAAGHPDVAALIVADGVLSGGKGLGYGGTGGIGRSARMYRALVSTGLARGAGSDFGLTLDPYLFTLGVAALPGADRDQIERTVDNLVTALRDVPVAETDLARAKKQIRAQVTYASEGVTNQAFRVGHLEIVDSYHRAATLLDDIAAITPEDVQRVANTYLRPEHRTVGWLIPDGEIGGGETAAPASAAVMQPRVWWLAAPIAGAANSYGFQRQELPNGMTVLGQVRPHSPSVDFQLRLLGGAVNDPLVRAGLTAFTARALLRGTGRRRFEEINDFTDSLGASIGVDAGRHFTELSIRCLVEDLPAMIQLAAEILREPIFPSDEVERIRPQMLSGIKEADNDTGSRAARAFRQLIFPPDHLYRRRVGGELDTVEIIQRDDLVAQHAMILGPAGATVAVVGGITSLAAVADLLDAAFGDWPTVARPIVDLPYPAPPIAAARQVEVVPGKSQADIVLGGPTIPRDDPRYHSLELGNLILGRLGLMGRLGATVRDEQGLAYHVASSIEVGPTGSLWMSRAGVDPRNIERAITGITEQLAVIQATPVSADELDDARNYLTGILPIALESNGGVAATLLNLERYNLGLDYLDRYPALIAAQTVEAIQAALQETVNPDTLAIGIGQPPAAGS